MAKANINLPDGTKITIEGNENEISGILSRYSTQEGKTDAPNKKVKHGKKEKSTKKLKVKKGPQKYILELQETGFFKSRRNINDVQKELEKEGHILPTNELSTPLRRLVTKKVLKRLNEKGTWVYVDR